jgi:putative transposon-encoded protein
MPRKVKFKVASELRLKGIVGFLRRRVTPYGTGAKVDCLKEFLGNTVYIVITDEEWQEE